MFRVYKLPLTANVILRSFGAFSILNSLVSRKLLVVEQNVDLGTKMWTSGQLTTYMYWVF